MFNYNPKVDGKEASDLFDKLLKDVTFDRKLLKQLQAFRIGWSRKGIMYSEFLGGNTLGVHPIRFSTRDDSELLNGIYNVDANTVYTNILKLPDISKSWKVATNPVLQILTYTMHRFIVDKKLGNKLNEALEECYYIFAYKVLGSLISHYFKYDTTPAIAKAVYERLSNRYLIKKLGTWNNVLQHRALDVLPPDGLHSKRLLKYTTDDSVRVVNDLQGRIRETIKNIYLIMLDVIAEDTKIKSTSLIESNNESDDYTRDLIERPDRYINRLHEVMGSSINLVDIDLIYLTSKLVKSSDTELMKDTLIRLSEDYDPRAKESKYLDNIILKTLAYSNLKGIQANYMDNLITIVNHMKGYWTSGTVNDKEVKQVKSYILDNVKASTKRKTKWYLTVNALAVIVYLFIRSIK